VTQVFGAAGRSTGEMLEAAKEFASSKACAARTDEGVIRRKGYLRLAAHFDRASDERVARDILAGIR